MTEREWFAVQDPLELLAFVQEHSGVALLEGPPRPPTGRFNLPELPPMQGRGGIFELDRPSTGVPAPGSERQEAELVRRLHLYLLGCCRAIWPLLPLESTRRGVEVAEDYIAGKATEEEFFHGEYDAEGAAFWFEYHDEDPDLPPSFREIRSRMTAFRTEATSREEREHWRPSEAGRRAELDRTVRDVAAIPAAEMRRLVRTVPTRDPLTPRHLLYRAAYFAHSAIMFPGISPHAGVVERYPEFLSAELLRRFVRYPLHAQMAGPGHVWWARYGTKA